MKTLIQNFISHSRGYTFTFHWHLRPSLHFLKSFKKGGKGKGIQDWVLNTCSIRNLVKSINNYAQYLVISLCKKKVWEKQQGFSKLFFLNIVSGKPIPLKSGRREKIEARGHKVK